MSESHSIDRSYRHRCPILRRTLHGRCVLLHHRACPLYYCLMSTFTYAAEHEDFTLSKRSDILRRDSVVFCHVIQHLLFSIFLCLKTSSMLILTLMAPHCGSMSSTTIRPICCSQRRWRSTIFSVVTSGTAKSEVFIQDTRFLSASEISVGSNSDFKIGSTFSCSKSVANVTEICFRWFFTSIVR